MNYDCFLLRGLGNSSVLLHGWLITSHEGNGPLHSGDCFPRVGCEKIRAADAGNQQFCVYWEVQEKTLSRSSSMLKKVY